MLSQPQPIPGLILLPKKYLINEFYIKDLSGFVKKKIKLPNNDDKANTPVKPSDLPDIYEEIISYYENTGYPFAVLIPENVSIKDSLISIDLKLEKNRKFYFNNIILKGDAKISVNWLSRYLSLKKGDVYSEKKLKEISSKIKSSGFLSEIKSPEVDFYKNKADVYLYLNSKKSNLFNGIVGFLPDKENPGKINFTGNADIKLINKFGKGENLSLSWQRSEKLSQKLDVGFALPFVFKTPFSAGTNFNLDKRDTSFMKIHLNGNLDYNFDNNDKISLTVQKKQSFILSPETVDTTVYKNSDIIFFGFSYLTEKYDNPLNPVFARFLNAGFSAGKRETDKNTGNIYEANILAEYYFPLYKNFVLKTSGKLKYAFPDDKLYRNELYDIGGFKSLRGFDENRFATSAFALINIEPRFLFAENSNVFIFFNTALLKEFNDRDTFLSPFGFGAGTNLETKAGILSLSYGIGNLPGNTLKFSDSKIHIGFLSRF